MKKFILLAALSSSAFANLHLAPPDFTTSRGRATFVDFKTAHYDITYNLETQETSVKSTIVFESHTAGTPLFDLIPSPANVRLNGLKVSAKEISTPDGVSQLRQVGAAVAPGTHTLELENTFDTNVMYDADFGQVSSAFWIRDLKTRMFLEQYIPSNYEFDQYQMTFTVNFAGVEKMEQEFFTNGKVTKLSPVSWRIDFPAHYTVSAPYYHTSPRGLLRRLDFTYQSISGRQIPMTVYSPWKSRTKKFKPEAIKVMKELEADYGPWLHDGFVAYGTMVGTGGMEHAGATQTSLGALDHEMLHSYFAKGVIPANGNSGWIDEAIASWRDKGYQRLPDPGFSGSNLGKHSVYRRNTDDRAYSLGAAFMAYLDWRLQNIGGLKAFLRGYAQTYAHQVVTTEHFKNNLEFFSGINFDDAFNQYIWGKTSEDAKGLIEANPNHDHLTAEQLRSIL